MAMKIDELTGHNNSFCICIRLAGELAHRSQKTVSELTG